MSDLPYLIVISYHITIKKTSLISAFIFWIPQDGLLPISGEDPIFYRLMGPVSRSHHEGDSHNTSVWPHHLEGCYRRLCQLSRRRPVTAGRRSKHSALWPWYTNSNYGAPPSHIFKTLCCTSKRQLHAMSQITTIHLGVITATSAAVAAAAVAAAAAKIVNVRFF